MLEPLLDAIDFYQRINTQLGFFQTTKIRIFKSNF